jgi:hypothetical protein
VRRAPTASAAKQGTGHRHAAKASIGSRTAENWVSDIEALEPLTMLRLTPTQSPSASWTTHAAESPTFVPPSGQTPRRPVFGGVELLQVDPAWQGLLWFNEYFEGDDGAGLGAMHQTGWTALVIDLLLAPPGMADKPAG